MWASRYDYKYFMQKREEMGSKAFNQEYMNNPLDEESQVFNPDDFFYYADADLSLNNCDIFAAVDFAMGKEKGDYSAIVTIARKRDTGICYVVDAHIERLKPDKFLQLIVKKSMQYQYERLAVESQQAQEWFADKLNEELPKHGYPAKTRIAKVKLTQRQRLLLWERLVNGHTVCDIEELYGIAHATISEHISIAAKKLVRVYMRWERGEND